MHYASVDFLDKNATHLPVHIYSSYIADVCTSCESPDSYVIADNPIADNGDADNGRC